MRKDCRNCAGRRGCDLDDPEDLLGDYSCWVLPAQEPPKEEGMKRYCSNCKHQGVSESLDRCASCWAKNRWEPEEDEEPKELTLRDRFAMAALTGIVAGVKDGVRFSHLTDQAYQFADAMLEARKEGK